MNIRENYDICYKCKYLEDGKECTSCNQHICIVCYLPRCTFCTRNNLKCQVCPACNYERDESSQDDRKCIYEKRIF